MFGLSGGMRDLSVFIFAVQELGGVGGWGGGGGGGYRSKLVLQLWMLVLGI